MSIDALSREFYRLLTASPRIHRARPYAVTVHDNKGRIVSTRTLFASSQYRAELAGLHSSVFVFKESGNDAVAVPKGWELSDLTKADLFESEKRLKNYY